MTDPAKATNQDAAPSQAAHHMNAGDWGLLLGLAAVDGRVFGWFRRRRSGSAG